MEDGGPSVNCREPQPVLQLSCDLSEKKLTTLSNILSLTMHNLHQWFPNWEFILVLLYSDDSCEMQDIQSVRQSEREDHFLI